MSVASIFIGVIWLVLTLSWTGIIVHSIGKQYGAHVAMSFTTRFSVFVAVGTAMWFVLKLLMWMMS